MNTNLNELFECLRIFLLLPLGHTLVQDPRIQGKLSKSLVFELNYLYSWKFWSERLDDQNIQEAHLNKILNPMSWDQGFI